MLMVAFKIARRFLSANRGQTALIITGIAVGVAVQVFVGVLITSLQGTLIDRTIGGSSQVTVVPAGDGATISDWQGLVDTARNDQDIKSVSPAADSSAFLIRSNRTLPILLRGFNMDDADKIYGISGHIYQGRRPSAPGEVLTGKELTKELGLVLGDRVELFTSSGSRSNLTVVGFYDLKVASLNKLWVLTTLETSQSVFGLGSNITSIEMQVKDIFKADAVASDLSRALGRTDVSVENWKDQNAELLSGLQGQSVSSYMIQVFVLASVIIAIASVLAIKVLQKSKEIGILKAMGIKDRSAGQIFVYQGLMLGAGGAITGILLALLLLMGFTLGARNPDGTALIDIRFDYLFIIGSGLVATVSAALASAIPARTTTRLSPIEVIRNG
jgi:lipoprotein-releasing system permease protein